MKTLVLSALISAAAVGNSMANNFSTVGSHSESNTEAVYHRKDIHTLREQVDFHKRNVDVLWDQYGRSVAKIKHSRGNHTELDREKAYFTSLYQQDIDNGVRIATSKQAIEEINELYAKKHTEREVFENERLAQLQAQLKAELRKEERKFVSSKKKYAKLENEQAQQLIGEAEWHFAQSIQRAEKLSAETAASVAAI